MFHHAYLEKYLNTGREIVFGIRPEDLHDGLATEEGKMPTIEIDVDVVEQLGPETLLYCKTRDKRLSVEEKENQSIDDDVSNLIAKVDNRSTTRAGQTIKIALDMAHCHIFDKETEVTILARSEENKAEIEAIQARREEEEAKKAEELAIKEAEEAAKKQAILDKQREKEERKLARKNKGEEVQIPTEEEVSAKEETQE